MKNYHNNILKNDLNHENDNNELNHIIVLEHSSTYTAGRQSKGFENENRNRLCALGAQVFDINRGGMVTWHGPGQLVIYPILNLKKILKPNFHHYIQQLQDLMIDICTELGLSNVTNDIKSNNNFDNGNENNKNIMKNQVGIWKENRKLGFIGFRNEGWITSHGCSLNINCDLNNFNHIIPCGDEKLTITSIERELGKKIDIEDAIKILKKSVEYRFNSEIIYKEMMMKEIE